MMIIGKNCFTIETNTCKESWHFYSNKVALKGIIKRIEIIISCTSMSNTFSFINLLKTLIDELLRKHRIASKYFQELFLKKKTEKKNSLMEKLADTDLIK